MSNPEAGTDQEFDVAIVGAGVAGCYTAWRLRGVDPASLKPDSPLAPLLAGRDKLRVGLFEGSHRIGGRLFSAALQGMPDEYAEFGGMRFYKQMLIVWNLIERLGLAGDAISFPVAQPENLVYVRGEHFRVGELDKGSADFPYNVDYLESGQSPGALIDRVSNLAVAGFTNLRKTFWAAMRDGNLTKAREIAAEYEARKKLTKIDGRTVYEMSWWQLQVRLLSHEAFQFVLETSGYDVTNTNGNAAHSLDQNFFAPEDGSFFRLKNGFESLPDTLHDAYHGEGGETFLGQRLVRFDKAPGAEGYDLQMVRGASNGAGGEPVTVRAKMLVLAMPIRSLCLLDQNNFFFRPENAEEAAKLDKGLDAVLSVPAFKLFMAYRRPWWETAGVTKGQSVTDLPIRQCYYWADNVGASSNSPVGANSVLMATYNNGAAVPFWESLQNGPLWDAACEVAADAEGFGGRAFAYDNNAAARVGATNGETANTPTREALPPTASVAMVEDAHRQLKALHGVTFAPEPYDAHFQDWTVDPYGGGWHQWKTNADEAALTPFMQQPLSGEAVFIVGECWSDSQGWVEGALNTSEEMLQERLGLTWPDWLEHSVRF